MTNRQLLFLGLGLFGLVALLDGFFIVDERERAVLFQLGQIRGVDYPPGLHFKVPFVQNVRKFDSRVLTLDSPTERFLTSEKKNVNVDFFVKWRILDTTNFYRATGGQEIIAMDRLASIVNRGLRDEFGVRTIQQAVSDERNEIMTNLKLSAKSKAAELGIEIIDVRVKRIDFDDDVRDSVYDRMRAERQRVASDLRARGAEEAERIRAEADREAEIILANAYRDAESLRGEGDAVAAEIYAAAYGKDEEFYAFYRSLNIYRNAWRGKDDILVLEPEGDLFRYFKSADGRARK